MNQDDYWDCPCCGQPTPPEHDKECHCGMRVSHHLSVSVLCKQLRDAQQRESALIVRNKKLEDEVNEQARLLGMSAERECDLRSKIDLLEREFIHVDLFTDNIELAYAVIQKSLNDLKEAQSES